MFVLFALLACRTVHEFHEVTEPASHYVIIDDDDRAWDCRSNPEGGDWAPTCVRVRYVSQAPENDDGGEESDGD